MPIYRYNHPTTIERIELRTTQPDVLQATLVTTSVTTAAQLERIRGLLAEAHFSTLIDRVDGHDIIEVRGINKEESLMKALAPLGLNNNDASKEVLPKDNPVLGFRERVRGKSLLLSALFYDLGNIAFFVSGIQRGRHNPDGKLTSNDISEILIGGAFSVGDVLMTMYGNHRGDEELSAAALALKRHLHQKGIALPEGDAMTPDNVHESGAFKAVDRWLRRHIVHVKCLTEFAGGLFTIHSALKPGARNNGKLAAGFLISAGWLSTLLFEKGAGDHILDGNKVPHTIGEKMADNPRAWLARPLAMANNAANLWGSLAPGTGERAQLATQLGEAQAEFARSGSAQAATALRQAGMRQHDYIWNVISACSFLVGHTLFGISGEKRPRETEDDKMLMNDLVLLSANMLAQQPEQVRNATVAETSQFMARLSHITASPDEIAQAIDGKIKALSEGQWASRVAASTAHPQDVSRA